VSISTHAAPSPRLNWRAALDLLDLWRARWTNRAPRHLPVLVIMVTDKCNLHCKMCGACDYSPGDHDMLSLEEWKAVIRSAARLRTRVLSITGGEALLRKDLFELIVYARAHGMAVHLNTNGLLLREKNVAALR
jgi:MoaA/NifB/PqqE/SkfB family radical SAM enzyme